MNSVLPSLAQINVSQVWRVAELEDGTAVLDYPIRPASGGSNGLYTAEVSVQ